MNTRDLSYKKSELEEAITRKVEILVGDFYADSGIKIKQIVIDSFVETIGDVGGVTFNQYCLKTKVELSV